MADILKEAQRLYTDGKWAESNQLVERALPNLLDVEDIVEAHRLYGWNYYYLGTKGPLEYKEPSLRRAADAFEFSFILAKDDKKRISIMNGLPLVLWNLGRERDAWLISDVATERFDNEPSVWNTRGILGKRAGRLKESVTSFEKVFSCATAKGDFRTAGSSMQNKGDCLKEMDRKEEARTAYTEAVGLYRRSEQTGISAKFHIEGVEKKLAAL